MLVRGGGSREDLVPFDDERVVRAVRSCPVPVVSGVGHDVDTTLCDMAADVRASTPSAAAELVFPDRVEIVRRLAGARERLERTALRQIAEQRVRLERSRASAVFRLRRRIAACVESLGAIRGGLRSAMELRLTEGREALSVRAASLDALSPLAVLARGFAACERGGERVRSARDLDAGDEVDLRFADGKAAATVNKILGSAQDPAGDAVPLPGLGAEP
jgi:exodeoxyribonuclease VII large subunit